MKPVILPLAIVALLTVPLLAADSDTSGLEETPDSGSSLIENGARMFFEGLLQEAQPAMRDLQDLMVKLGPQLRSFAREMGPALADILKDIDDLSVYAAPEKLPNGDIIIRRKPPADEAEPPPERPPYRAPDSSTEIEI